ncbi:hypothetical protein K438DRAFT_1791020 [Mycena galopus ATCC 62051]|nr:hypothetical protein K438DRAFT_1791020 [Mycena galopus ATCC 62051]
MFLTKGGPRQPKNGSTRKRPADGGGETCADAEGTPQSSRTPAAPSGLLRRSSLCCSGECNRTGRSRSLLSSRRNAARAWSNHGLAQGGRGEDRTWGGGGSMNGGGGGGGAWRCDTRRGGGDGRTGGRGGDGEVGWRGTREGGGDGGMAWRAGGATRRSGGRGSAGWRSGVGNKAGVAGTRGSGVWDGDNCGGGGPGWKVDDETGPKWWGRQRTHRRGCMAPASAAANAAPRRKLWPENSVDEYPAFVRQSSRARRANARVRGIPAAVTNSGWGAWSGTDEDTGPASPDVGFACLYVTEHGGVGDAGDTSLREVDGGVKGSAIGDCKLTASHKSRPSEGERGGEHPAVVVVGELRKDVRENLTGDSAARPAGLCPVTALCSSNEPFEDWAVEGIKGPPMFRMNGSETGEVAGEGRGLHFSGFDRDPELNGGSVSRENTAVRAGKSPLAGELAECCNVAVVLDPG